MHTRSRALAATMQIWAHELQATAVMHFIGSGPFSRAMRWWARFHVDNETRADFPEASGFKLSEHVRAAVAAPTDDCTNFAPYAAARLRSDVSHNRVPAAASQPAVLSSMCFDECVWCAAAEAGL